MLFVEIIGNLGSDPEQRFTQDGKSQVSIRVAVNSRRKDANGDQVERTDWFRVRMGGGRGDYVARELRKGSRVLVRGRLEIGEWTTREGEVRTSYDIWADDVINLTPREGSPRGNEQAEQAEQPVSVYMRHRTSTTSRSEAGTFTLMGAPAAFTPQGPCGHRTIAAWPRQAGTTPGRSSRGT